ncbi:MAG: hypothetical protein FWD90_06745 [Defluviitaleaceae bacterium]|nr:hypothetical protein [Defluviitaleaceae bacterium]
MNKNKNLLPENTVIIWNAHPIGDYRNFLYETIGKDFVDGMDYSVFQKWLFSHTGKTLKDVANEVTNGYKTESMADLLSEVRFNILSESDKTFMQSFDKEMKTLGYDCENIIGSGLSWGMYMIAYGKTGTKSRPNAARIYIKEDGEVCLRLFLNKVDKHMKYIENTPVYIKNAFIFEGGDCKSCNTACAPGKVYTIDGLVMQKCNHSTFYFYRPQIEILTDVMVLMTKFYPVKKKV